MTSSRTDWHRLQAFKVLPNRNKIAGVKRLNSGFTLIELMIVVAIIGILAAIAIPQYQNYVASAQAAEGFSLAGGLKTALAEYHNTNGVFPDGTTDAHTELGIELATTIVGKYVDGVVVSNDGNGTITATFGSGNHAGKFLRLTPEPTDGAISFNCTTDVEEDWRPSDCEDGLGGGSVTLHSVDPPDTTAELPPFWAASDGTKWKDLSAAEKECGGKTWYPDGVKKDGKGVPKNPLESAECDFPICWKDEWDTGHLAGWVGNRF